MPEETNSIRILLVCRGNTCRSAMAEGVLRAQAAARGLAARIAVSSAGTHVRATGAPADPRAITTAARKDIDLTAHRTRAVRDLDLAVFDRIVALDRANLAFVHTLVADQTMERVALLLDSLPGHEGCDVSDPFDGGPADYDNAMDLIETACGAVIDGLAGE